MRKSIAIGILAASLVSGNAAAHSTATDGGASANQSSIVSFDAFEDGSARIVVEWNNPKHNTSDEYSYVVLVQDAETGTLRILDSSHAQ